MFEIVRIGAFNFQKSYKQCILSSAFVHTHKSWTINLRAHHMRVFIVHRLWKNSTIISRRMVKRPLGTSWDFFKEFDENPLQCPISNKDFN